MICVKCNLDKLKTDFYIEGYYKNSHKCKTCWREKWSEQFQKRKYKHNEWAKQYYKSNPKFRAKRRKYYVEWYKSNGRSRSDLEIESTLRWQKENPEKVRVQKILQRAVYKGDIIRPNICSTCNRQAKIHAHHEDYNKPLEVMWLCASCHKRYHTHKTSISELAS